MNRRETDEMAQAIFLLTMANPGRDIPWQPVMGGVARAAFLHSDGPALWDAVERLARPRIRFAESIAITPQEVSL